VNPTPGVPSDLDDRSHRSSKKARVLQNGASDSWWTEWPAGLRGVVRFTGDTVLSPSSGRNGMSLGGARPGGPILFDAIGRSSRSGRLR
jgi:hypothetical protein